jgi:diguanylate cyclase (GGDEF)-like protein
MVDTRDTLERISAARTRAAVRGLALLNAQADALRAQLKELGAHLTDAHQQLSAERSALIVQANEQLVLAALRADTIAEAARENLDQLAQSAQRDPLTGLPNRALMLDRMQATIARAGRRDLSFGVLFIDLDRFKLVNDSHGHAAGDEVLRQVARRLEAAVRETDTVSRHSGDEFVVLLAELSPGADAGVLASKVLRELGEPIQIGDSSISVSASIGISLYPADAFDAQTLIAQADAAMYAAKRRGPGLIVFHRDLPKAVLQPAELNPARSLVELKKDRPGAVPTARKLLTQQLHPQHVTFLSTVAHELRNPLAPLRYAAELLTRTDSDEERLSKLQGIIVRQVARMVRLVDDLLHVSREGAGKFRLEYADVDVGQLFTTVLEACQPAITARRQHIETRFPAQWPPLRGDAVRLAQIFGNLLDNASRYTPPEGCLTFAVALSPGNIEVVVSDTGLGISAEALPHIFDLFVQENREASVRSDGLGIGLAVVRELVHGHGGTVIASSDGPNLGSSFTVSLPMGQRKAPAVALAL